MPQTTIRIKDAKNQEVTPLHARMITVAVAETEVAVPLLHLVVVETADHHLHLQEAEVASKIKHLLILTIKL